MRRPCPRADRSLIHEGTGKEREGTCPYWCGGWLAVRSSPLGCMVCVMSPVEVPLKEARDNCMERRWAAKALGRKFVARLPAWLFSSSFFGFSAPSPVRMTHNGVFCVFLHWVPWNVGHRLSRVFPKKARPYSMEFHQAAKGLLGVCR